MKRALGLLLALIAVGAAAAEVSVTLVNGKLAGRVDSLDFPETLAKELTSGLTSRLYMRATVVTKDKVLGQRIVETAIRYDLWDQQFVVVTILEGTVVDSRHLARLQDVTSLLAAIPLPAMFDAATLPATTALTLRVEVLLNPIDREKMRMVRKWVAQNSAPQVGGNPGVSISNAIFNRIFEQYADGSSVAAAWRATTASPAFRIDALAHEGH